MSRDTTGEAWGTDKIGLPGSGGIVGALVPTLSSQISHLPTRGRSWPAPQRAAPPQRLVVGNGFADAQEFLIEAIAACLATTRPASPPS